MFTCALLGASLLHTLVAQVHMYANEPLCERALSAALAQCRTWRRSQRTYPLWMAQVGLQTPIWECLTTEQINWYRACIAFCVTLQ